MSSNNAGALRVSIVVPCRNERHYIDSFIDSVSAQLPVAGGCEIIIADGMSEDGTRELLDRRSAGTPALRWIDNPSKTVSHGLNLAVAAARGEIIIRMDVHTHYARDYVAECVRVLDATDADNVGGPWRATGGSYLQSAIAIAFNSPFAVGGARSHDVSFEGVVDSVYLGCWRRSRLIEIGLFDEELVRNQDDELNLRLTRCGGTVWQSPTIQSQYSPRASLRNLLKQYMQYGYWKVRVIQKHRMPASLRHVIPAGYVSALVLAGYRPGYDGYGAIVAVQHRYGYSTLYAHLSQPLVHPGQHVFTGQKIGIAGCTGWCTGTHLHFELRYRGIPLDPTFLMVG